MKSRYKRIRKSQTTKGKAVNNYRQAIQMRKNIKSKIGCLGGSVNHLIRDLSSGLNLRVMSSSPALGSTLGVKPT